MKVLMSGASGLVGRATTEMLRARGDVVVPLVRGSSTDGVPWKPDAGWLDEAALRRTAPDMVIHLAGENIADGRWTEEKKRRIRDSRVLGTQLLARSLASLDPKPRLLLSAAAIGIYGNRGDELRDETSPAGDSFLAHVARDWEAATAPAEAAGIRVVHLRIGVVLTPLGGALKAMLTPFRLGVGGVVGDGRQYLSWISLTDLIGMIRFILERDDIRGSVNAVSPNPATNREFTKTLGRVLNRPTIFPLPGFLIRAIFGEMGEATLLASTRAIPRRLSELGFTFQHPELEAALRHELGK
ncbi:MAG: TIGR01777 family oxidoreductase [Phycisphaerae bacterium]|nr:TIGR01777 family oxidoreductase [Phycisphaerae bacterium]